jgi:hypothetical protein
MTAPWVLRLKCFCTMSYVCLIHRYEGVQLLSDQHRYQSDPHSGAGNCVCGNPERHRRHPHEFMRAQSVVPAGSRSICTCGLAFVDKVHT